MGGFDLYSVLDAFSRTAVTLELRFDPIDSLAIALGALPPIAKLRESFNRGLVFFKIEPADERLDDLILWVRRLTASSLAGVERLHSKAGHQCSQHHHNHHPIDPHPCLLVPRPRPRGASIFGMTTARAALVIVVAVAAACTRQPGETSRPAQVPSGPRLYVTNERSGDLTVIDIATRQPIATVPLGKRPRGIRATADGKTLYIALSGSPFAPPGIDEKTLPPPDRSADGIGVFDTTTMKLVRVIAAGTDPEQLSLSKDGARLYVANEDAATASVVEIASGTIVTVVKVGVEPEGVETSPDGTYRLRDLRRRQ